MKKYTKKLKAFTLIEMLIVVGILGILVSVATPAVYRSMSETRATAMSATLKTLQDAETRYQILLLQNGYTEADFPRNINIYTMP